MTIIETSAPWHIEPVLRNYMGDWVLAADRDADRFDLFISRRFASSHATRRAAQAQVAVLAKAEGK